MNLFRDRPVENQKIPLFHRTPRTIAAESNEDDIIVISG